MSQIQSRSLQGRFKWTYIRGRESDFPELYMLNSPLGDRIKVEVNRLRKQVRITADTRLGNNIQSIISNGVIIKEKDLTTNKYLNLDEYFSDLSLEISSLPDNEVLGIIGGNYDILTEFLGQVKYDDRKTTEESHWQLLKNYFLRRPRIIYQTLVDYLRSFFARPSLWDIVDSAALGGLAWSVYQLNFNLFLTGFVTCLAALTTGVFDWLFRRRDPYIIKILLFMVPGVLAIYLGYRLQ